MRIVFMGSPEFAVPSLDALVEAGHEIAAVYCQPPRPAGRGKAPRPTAVQLRAKSLGIEVRTPISLRPAEEQGSLITIVVSWELCWYRYEVDVAGGSTSVRPAGQGYELDELAHEDRVEPNASADEYGALALL